MRALVALVVTLVACPSWAEPSGGTPARYIVFELDAAGVPRAQSHQLVTLPAPLVSRTDAEMDALLRAGLRGGERIAVRMKDAAGVPVFQDVVEVPRWVNAEHGLFGESPLVDDVLPAQKAFVVRLPSLEGARLALTPAGGEARVTATELDLDALAADQTLPLASYRPRAALSEPAPNSGNRVDLLIMGDGYTSAQQTKFSTDAANLVASFFSASPYAEYKSFVNTSTLFTASAQAGADHPPYNASCAATTFPSCCADATMQTDPLRGTFVTTAFDGTYCSFNIHRLVVVNNSKVLTAAAASPGWDEILVVVNDTTYGGSGGQVGVLSTHASAVAVAQHEYGHTFTKLADEYTSAYPGFPACTDAAGSSTPCESNVTDQTSRSAIKWNPWILGSTPVPTTGTDPTIVGLFLGARYLTSGMYRPQYDCGMKSLGVAFCKVCAQGYVLALYRGGWGTPSTGIDTIEPGSESPAPGTVSLTLPGSRVFSVTLLQPQGNTVAGTWYLNGVAAGSGSTYTFSPSTAGTYTVMLRAHDGTSLVNATMGGALLDRTRTWTVNVTGTGGSTPTVASVSPSSGPTTGGTPVTVTGTNFVSGATVSFAGSAASNVVVNGATSISCKTPAGSAGPVTVSVTTSGGTGSLPSGFTYTGGGGGPCTPSATSLCLNGSRFRLTSRWTNYNDGSTGDGVAVPLTNDTGYFWFFNSSNVELVIKVLDGRGVNGAFWVLYGALSDVGYTIQITDTVTGVVKSFVNPAHVLASVADINAFPAARGDAPPVGAAVALNPPEVHAEALLANVPPGERSRGLLLYRFDSVSHDRASRLFSTARAALYLHGSGEALILSESAPDGAGRFVGVRTVSDFVRDALAEYPEIANPGSDAFFLKLPAVRSGPDGPAAPGGAVFTAGALEAGPKRSPQAATPLAATTVVSEGWESGWSSRWLLSDNNGGMYRWTASTCTVHSGSYAADMLGGTVGGNLPCDAAYPNNYDGWMVYASCIGIQNASAASLQYWLNVNSELEYDTLGVYFKRPADGLYYGHMYSGNSAGFRQYVDDLKSWPVIGDLTQIACNTLGIAFHSDDSVAPGWGARVDDLSVTATTGGGVACAPTATALCLNASRFKVSVQWKNYNDGSQGPGYATSLTNDTGHFWFFNSANVELVIKILDGRSVNGKFWVFYGALSDVEYTITVTDSQTGAVKPYYNPPHKLGSVADIVAFNP